MMDKNDIDNALHEIRQMVFGALDAADGLLRSDAEPAFFPIPEDKAEMLCFCMYDLHKRVAELKDGLFGAAKNAPDPDPSHDHPRWARPVLFQGQHLGGELGMMLAGI